MTGACNRATDHTVPFRLTVLDCDKDLVLYLSELFSGHMAPFPHCRLTSLMLLSVTQTFILFLFLSLDSLFNNLPLRLALHTYTLMSRFYRLHRAPVMIPTLIHLHSVRHTVHSLHPADRMRRLLAYCMVSMHELSYTQDGSGMYPFLKFLEYKSCSISPRFTFDRAILVFLSVNM